MSRLLRARGVRGMLVVAVLTVACMTGAAHAAPTVTNGTATSFDGTPISYTFFAPEGASASAPVPIIFYTHGWGGSRATAPTENTVSRMLGAGYAVLTWDARGFGTSGGEANVDSQEYEVRDVQALIGIAASRPEVLTDAPGDPRMGMIGGSYAGGIQLETASADNRVDAIVPYIAWNNLPQSLKPNGVLKEGWDLLLYGSGLATGTQAGLSAGQTGAYAPQIHQSLAEGTALNDWSQTTFQWFDAKSPKNYINGGTLPDGRTIPGLNAPTLIVQGTSDTLFPLNEGIANYEQIRARGVPAAMIWYCGGHTIALISASFSSLSSCVPGTVQGSTLNAAVLDWFDRYVKNKLSSTAATPLSGILYQAQDGSFHSAPELPAERLTASKSGIVVANQVAPSSGQVLLGTPSADGTRIPVAGAAGRRVLGIAKATLTVTSTAPEAYLFLKLIDRDTATGKEIVVDDQVTAVKFSWAIPGIPRTLTIDMSGVAWDVLAGHELSVEIGSTSNDHASSRFASVSTVAASVTVPVV